MLNNHLNLLWRKYCPAILMLVFISVNPVSAKIKSYKKDADGVTFVLDKGAMKIKICRDDIIEVKYTAFNTFNEKQSLVVNNKWLTKPGFKVTDTATILTNTDAFVMPVFTAAARSICGMQC